MAKEVVTGVNKVGNSYYRTKVVDNGDGTFSSTLFRTDAQGNNDVPIAGYGAVGNQVAREINTTNATAEEQKLLSDTNSQLNQVRRDQVRSTENEFFGTDGTATQQSSLDKVSGGSGNQTAVDPNNPGAAGGSTPTNPNVAEPTQQTTPQSLKYPLDLGRNQDTIMFTAVEYIPPGLNETRSVAGQRQNPKRSSKGTVTLPIQAQINDSNRADWALGEMNELYRKALDTSFKAVTGKLSTSTFSENSLDKDIQKSIDKFKDPSNRNLMLALLAQSVIPNVGNIQGRFGGILNPNVELLFTGPTLRPFSFSFRMSPRGKQEAKDVKSIIRFFKQNMAPKRQDGNLFLKAPNTFLIKYQGAGEQGLNKIKECALIDCSVNYTPQGSYMTYEDGTMVSYFMSLTFSEIEPVYDVDYKDNHPIGF